MPYFKNQTKLQLKSNIDISAYAVDSADFKYIKPDATTGSFTATVNTNSDTITYNAASTSDFDVVGHWKVWLEITDTNGDVARAETSLLYIEANDI